MPYIRLRVKLNKGRQGIALDKLEKFVAETRRFLTQAAEDLEIKSPSLWVGTEFENSSLAFTNQFADPVSNEAFLHFNESILSLGQSSYPRYLQETTADQFFKITSSLDKGEIAEFAVYDGQGDPKWMEVSESTARLARRSDVLPFRITQGSIQGTYHSIHQAAERPYFTLRELSSRALIKCFYMHGDYEAIWAAAKVMDTILHVRGTISTDTHKRSVDHVTVSNIIVAESYSFADVEKFLGANWSQ